MLLRRAAFLANTPSEEACSRSPQTVLGAFLPAVALLLLASSALVGCGDGEAVQNSPSPKLPPRADAKPAQIPAEAPAASDEREDAAAAASTDTVAASGALPPAPEDSVGASASIVVPEGMAYVPAVARVSASRKRRGSACDA